MGLFIYRFQLLNCIMGIDLGRSQVGMTKNFFDGIEIRTVIQHMGGKSMPYDMRASFADRGDLVQVVMYDTVD